MSDVTYFNYPFNSYVFTPLSLRQKLLMQQGCDLPPRRLYGGGYGGCGGYGYGYSGCCAAQPCPPLPPVYSTGPFIYQ
ncbi:hypothetical protein EBU60_04915 [bacterium]|nr:hypothetical protein [bacterium]